MLKKEAIGGGAPTGGTVAGGTTTTANVGPYQVPLGNPKKPTPMLRRGSPVGEVGKPVYKVLPKIKKK